MLIFTHPNNLALLKKKLNSGDFDGDRFLPSFTVQTHRDMERDKPTGRYSLQDGTLIELDEVVVHTRFIEYGPEDVGYLVLAGIITEERAALFNLIDDDLRFSEAIPVIMPRRYVTFAGGF